MPKVHTGWFPCGTTGEGVTLSIEEHVRVVELCVEAAAGRVPVIAGAGSNNTAHAIELAQARQGAPAPTRCWWWRPITTSRARTGFFAHFKAINDAVEIPIVVYNVPARTMVDISVETMGRLAQAAERGRRSRTRRGDLARVARHRAVCGEEFIQLSGDDPSASASTRMAARLHLGDRERRAEAVRANAGRDAAGRFRRRRARSMTSWRALHKAMFMRAIAGAGEVRLLAARPLHRRGAPADLAAAATRAKAKIRAAMTQAGLI